MKPGSLKWLFSVACIFEQIPLLVTDGLTVEYRYFVYEYLNGPDCFCNRADMEMEIDSS